MKRIRKIVIPVFGDESQLEVVTCEIDLPKWDEVQIHVDCSPVSGADINMRKGIYPMQRKAPLTPGYSVIGRIEELGLGKTDFKIGDRVACLTVYEGQSELVNVPAKFVVAVPESVDTHQAAAMVLDWGTAKQMIDQNIQIKKGDRVFVHGLSGSVGRAILALAKLKGAEVFGTASVANHAELRVIGAKPFAYSDKNWIREVQAIGGVDAVFDPLGFESFNESDSVLRKGGVLVAYGMNLASFRNAGPPAFVLEYLRLLAKNLKFWNRKRYVFFGFLRGSKHYRPTLTTLLGQLERGEISPPIKAVYALSDVSEAHRAWANGGGMGTIILSIK